MTRSDPGTWRILWNVVITSFHPNKSTCGNLWKPLICCKKSYWLIQILENGAFGRELVWQWIDLLLGFHLAFSSKQSIVHPKEFSTIQKRWSFALNPSKLCPSSLDWTLNPCTTAHFWHIYFASKPLASVVEAQTHSPHNLPLPKNLVVALIKMV